MTRRSCSKIGSRVADAWLLDTGFLVAVVNRSDPDHQRCLEVVQRAEGRVVSVEGVIIEAYHLLRKTRGGRQALLALVESWEVEWLPMGREVFAAARAVLVKYGIDRTDWVDATLVVTADALDITDVLTLDVRDFSRFRQRGRHRFDIHPAPR